MARRARQRLLLGATQARRSTRSSRRSSWTSQRPTSSPPAEAVCCCRGLPRRGLRPKAKQLIEQAQRSYSHEGSVAGLSEANAMLGLWYEEAEDYSNAVHYYQKGFELDRKQRGRRRTGRAKRARWVGSSARRATPHVHRSTSTRRAICSPRRRRRTRGVAHRGRPLGARRIRPRLRRAVERFNEALKSRSTTATSERSRRQAEPRQGCVRSSDLSLCRTLLREARPLLEAGAISGSSMTSSTTSARFCSIVTATRRRWSASRRA